MHSSAPTPHFPVEEIALDRIRLNGGTQPRAGGVNETVASDYADVMREAAENNRPWPFPPAIVYYDRENYWLAGGFHRHRACELAGRGTMPCEIRPGTRRDAIVIAVGENAAHGLQRTAADKRKAVDILIRDPEWSTWSVAEIARAAKVSRALVVAVRDDAGIPKPDIVRCADGKTRPSSLVPSQPVERQVEGGDDQAPVRQVGPSGVQPVEREPDRSDHEETDPLGQPIPLPLRPVFATRREMDALRRQLHGIMSAIERLSKHPGGEKFHAPTATAPIKNLIDLIARAMPKAVCPICDGQSNGNCRDAAKAKCQARGWVNLDLWNGLTSEDQGHAERSNRAA